MKILLAVDGSTCSARAVRALLQRLPKLGRRPAITLINVDPPLLSQVAARLGPREVARYHESNGRDATRAARASLHRAGVSFDERRVVGDPAGTIARTAKDERFDLIVAGTHGRGALKNLLLGSTVTRLLAQSRVPVMVVP